MGIETLGHLHPVATPVEILLVTERDELELGQVD